MKIYPNKEIKKNITDEIKSISKSIRKIEKSLGEYNSVCVSDVSKEKKNKKIKQRSNKKFTQRSNKKFTQKSKRLMLMYPCVLGI